MHIQGISRSPVEKVPELERYFRSLYYKNQETHWTTLPMVWNFWDIVIAEQDKDQALTDLALLDYRRKNWLWKILVWFVRKALGLKKADYVPTKGWHTQQEANSITDTYFRVIGIREDTRDENGNECI